MRWQRSSSEALHGRRATKKWIAIDECTTPLRSDSLGDGDPDAVRHCEADGLGSGDTACVATCVGEGVGASDTEGVREGEGDADSDEEGDAVTDSVGGCVRVIDGVTLGEGVGVGE